MRNSYESPIEELKAGFEAAEFAALQTAKKKKAEAAGEVLGDLSSDKLLIPTQTKLRPRFVEIEKEARSEIQNKKRQLTSQTEQKVLNKELEIANIAKGLYEEISKNPNRPAKVLFIEYAQGLDSESFPPETAAIFARALDNYEIKRNIVKKYSSDFKQPEMLFEKCFGKKPKGQVEVIYGSMTICFRCFEEEDYVLAFTHSKQPTPHSLERDIQRAKSSGGAALSGVKIPELNGVVILEKASNNRELKNIMQDREAGLRILIEGRWQTIAYPPPPSTEMVWEAKGHKITFVLIRSKMAEGEVEYVNILDNGSQLGSERTVPVDSKFPIKEFKVETPSKGDYTPQYIKVKITDEGLLFSGKFGAESSVSYKQKVGAKWAIKDRDASRQIRIHEEQHQFNRLFAPSESFAPVSREDFKKLISSRENDPAEKRALVIKRLASFYRQIYVDPQARDELLAYFKDGRKPEDILRILKTSKLYDFASSPVKEFSGEEITTKQRIVNIIWMQLKDKKLSFIKDDKWHHIGKFNGPDFEFTEEEVKNVVENSFGQDYAKSLELWVSQIKKLQDLGYDNNEIVSYLATLPVNRWRNFVNRLAKSHKRGKLTKE